MKASLECRKRLQAGTMRFLVVRKLAAFTCPPASEKWAMGAGPESHVAGVYEQKAAIQS
jgi:hypothetical protein